MAPRNNQSSTVSCDKCRSLKVKCVREDTQATCAKLVHTGILLMLLRPIERSARITDETLEDASNLAIDVVLQSDRVIKTKVPRSAC